MSKAYNSESLEVLEGLDPVKVRPSMYTDTTRPNHLAQEVIDNAVDEAMAGYATRIKVSLLEDGSCVVEDNGRGIPVEIHAEKGVPGVELILTKLHAGAKFSNDTYAFSGGLHGVGISVVNALSKQLEVEIKRAGVRYGITFADGEKTQDLHTLGEVAKRDTGTHIRFLPDAKYFDHAAIASTQLQRLLRAKAVLCAGLEIHFEDAIAQSSITWCYKEGIKAYAQDVLETSELFLEEPIVRSHEQEGLHIEWLLSWQEQTGSGGLQESFVNMIPTAQGGVHVNGLRQGVLDAVREFCELRQLCPKGIKLKAEDIWECAQYVLSIKIHNPQFAGQTKEKLVNQSLALKIAGIARDQLSHWLNQHIKQAECLVEAFVERARSRMQDTQKTKRKKWTAGPKLPGKLTDCVSSSVKDTELFIVEGDSAGGSARQARDKQTQAVLPLRGKILNTWELSGDKVMASQDINDLCVAMGVDAGSGDLSGLRYGKICILTDADSDGNHISTLLCALFLKHFPDLVARGHVYVAMPPLYRIDYGKKWCYVLDDEQKERKIAQLKQKSPKLSMGIQRFKGLGEMNPIQLKETTMAVEHRKLLQLTLTTTESEHAQQQLSGEEAGIMNNLMSKKRVAERKKWLFEEGGSATVL